jgi:hypothetical protein
MGNWTCRLYGESNAAAPGESSEDFSHFGIGIACKAESEPRKVRDELIVSLGIHLVGYDSHPAGNLSLEVLDPFLGKVSHVARASERLTGN